MNEMNFVKAMNLLSDELKDAATANPYDPDAYNDVVHRIQALHSYEYRGRRRRPWSALISVLLLLFALLLIVHTILKVLYTEGTT